MSYRFGVLYVNGAGASFDSPSLFSSSSIDIIGFDIVKCDSVSLEDVGVESERT